MDLLKEKHFAFTTNVWSALAYIWYLTCTAHFADKLLWTCTLQYEKDDTSRADDIVNCCVSQLTLFDLSYSKAIPAVTDKEATTISAGHPLMSRSLREGAGRPSG